jgi:hypothetical protein
MPLLPASTICKYVCFVILVLYCDVTMFQTKGWGKSNYLISKIIDANYTPPLLQIQYPIEVHGCSRFADTDG